MVTVSGSVCCVIAGAFVFGRLIGTPNRKQRAR